MCSHYQAIKERERYLGHFGVAPPTEPGKLDGWPGYAATFIRRPREADVGDEAVSEREALCGVFGLIPHWATDTKIGRQTVTTRQSMDFMRQYPAGRLQAAAVSPTPQPLVG